MASVFLYTTYADRKAFDRVEVAVILASYAPDLTRSATVELICSERLSIDYPNLALLVPFSCDSEVILILPSLKEVVEVVDSLVECHIHSDAVCSCNCPVADPL